MIYNQKHRRKNRTATFDIGSHLKGLARTIRPVRLRDLVYRTLKERLVYEILLNLMNYPVQYDDVYRHHEVRHGLLKRTRTYRILLVDVYLPLAAKHVNEKVINQKLYLQRRDHVFLPFVLSTPSRMVLRSLLKSTRTSTKST